MSTCVFGWVAAGTSAWPCIARAAEALGLPLAAEQADRLSGGIPSDVLEQSPPTDALGFAFRTGALADGLDYAEAWDSTLPRLSAARVELLAAWIDAVFLCPGVEHLVIALSDGFLLSEVRSTELSGLRALLAAEFAIAAPPDVVLIVRRGRMREAT